MKYANKPPAAIWLQFNGDAEPDEDGPVRFEDVTWSVDRVFRGDTKYVQETRQNTMKYDIFEKVWLREAEEEAEIVLIEANDAGDVVYTARNAAGFWGPLYEWEIKKLNNEASRGGLPPL